MSAGWWLPTAPRAGRTTQTAVAPAAPGRAELMPVAGPAQADFSGTITSRSFDAESGQVTLQQVYAQ
jgi:hypothetical protein